MGSQRPWILLSAGQIRNIGAISGGSGVVDPRQDRGRDLLVIAAGCLGCLDPSVAEKQTNASFFAHGVIIRNPAIELLSRPYHSAAMILPPLNRQRPEPIFMASQTLEKTLAE